ncbi:MAG: hypothetical protein QNJ18_07980 [Xenococcaceae cyanobacterium MO_167.B52]|nr:hypothetical protein [Xenococcaceae cyanobacterium MO_167.B52]
MTPPAQNLLVPTPIKLLIHTLIVVLVTFEAIAVTSCDNSTMKNTDQITNQNTNVPSVVAQAVLEDLSQQTQIPLSKLTITKAKKELWSNGCLDLAQEGEFCTQAIVPGWRVFVSGDDQTWIYHTDQQGRSLRVEP